MYTFLLADDHSIVRSGIKGMIREHFSAEFIHEACNGKELEKSVKQHAYHLIMLDINLPDADFSTTLPWIVNTCPDTPVLVFSAFPEEIYGLRSIRMGASGYLHKAAPNQEIIHAIGRVLSGKKYIPTELVELLVKEKKHAASDNPFSALSDRELEIATLIEKGMSLTQISHQLNIQYSTCNTYKRRIFEKLEISNIVTLTRLMQAHGIF
jgi:two-component system invasion response regulator UvrY